MPGFIFLCDFATEQECLERKLFGTNPGEMQRHHYSKIAVGDVLFLYNFEIGALRGPYKAVSECKLNIEPSAWKKSKRNFPWQVRVEAAEGFPKPIRADELRNLVALASTKMGLLPPAELTDAEWTSLMDALRKQNAAK